MTEDKYPEEEHIIKRNQTISDVLSTTNLIDQSIQSYILSYIRGDQFDYFKEIIFDKGDVSLSQKIRMFMAILKTEFFPNYNGLTVIKNAKYVEVGEKKGEKQYKLVIESIGFEKSFKEIENLFYSILEIRNRLAHSRALYVPDSLITKKNNVPDERLRNAFRKVCIIEDDVKLFKKNSLKIMEFINFLNENTDFKDVLNILRSYDRP